VRVRDFAADKAQTPETEDLSTSARPQSSEVLRGQLARLPDSHPSSPGWREVDGSVAAALGHRRPSELTILAAGREDRKSALSPWDASGVSVNADRPAPETIRLTEDRMRHILDGDQWGGGHRHGAGHSGKTEFPSRWSDMACLTYIADVAREPDDTPIWQPNHRWLAHGVRDGVDVKVVVNHDGRIWTAWPEPGGPGVVRNPEEA
jgi:hypothetical protein